MTGSLIVAAAAASAVELSVCLLCAIQLFRRRKETSDNSRAFLSYCALFCVITSLFKIIDMSLFPADNIYTDILPHTLVLFGLFSQVLVLIYPLTVIRPQMVTPGLVTLLYTPWFILFVIYIFMPSWTILETFSEIGDHIGEFNVIYRLVTMAFYIPFALFLFFIPYNKKEAAVAPSHVLVYTLGICVLTLLHFGFFMTGCIFLHIVHQVWLAALFYIVSRFDLEERLLPLSNQRGVVPTAAEALLEEEHLSHRYDSPMERARVVEIDKAYQGKPLWDRIVYAMDEKEVWRQPELSVDQLAMECGTNIPYINNCVKENTGYGCNEYINRKRIEYVCSKLEEDPMRNLQAVFFDAGYRSRTTAWRNFKEIVGVSPSEFRASKR